ncbi:MAG: carbohydrate kinase family protein [Candidatus Kariarchaeaceae archaeon]|jgi:ribokinase
MKVGVMGNCYIDEIFVIDKFPKSDEKITASDVKLVLGGSASNFAVGIAKLGANTTLFSAVGQDSSGKELITQLEDHKIVTEFIEIQPGKTGRTIIFLDKNKSSTKIGYPGVCTNLAKTLNLESIFQYLPSFDHIHLASTRIELVDKILRNVKQPISLDLGAKTLDCDHGKLKEVLSKVSIVFMNQGTFKRLYGEDISLNALKKRKEFNRLFITAGEKGVFARIDDQVHFQKAIATSVVDTTGAGDAFAAMAIWSIIKKKTPVEILKYAATAASLKIKTFGGSNGHPDWNDVMEKITEKS